MKPLLYLIATDISSGNLPKAPTDHNQVENVLRIVLGIIGAMAVLLIVVSGLRLALRHVGW
jgi:hypothetical protein